MSESGAVAVQGRDIVFYHGGRKHLPTLDGLNITVPKGIIYGLLGPSGCGKTTLLRCIVGRHKPKSGTVRVYGRVPGEPGFCIPGCGVGYMPQELALYPEITTEETLRYFGRLYQMEEKTISERISFLIKFLHLPEKKRFIKNLSGGQQRRVSFAAALIHKPPLVILDEPTVGVDPLLRQNIWDHLETLTATEHLTIIVTTHYVEEAHQANVVGLMREGRLLAEMNPDRLIEMYGVNTLEAAFLKLCRMDNQLQEQAATAASVVQPLMSVSVDEQKPAAGEIWQKDSVSFSNTKKVCIIKQKRDSQNTEILHKVPEMQNLPLQNNREASDADKQNHNIISPKEVQNDGLLLNGEHNSIEIIYHKMSHLTQLNHARRRLGTIVSKNFVQLKRNKPLVCFQILLPFVQALLFCLCVGEQPSHLRIAVVNQESNYFGFAREFLEQLNPKTIIQLPYDNLSTAIDTVKSGHAWGAMHIGPQFSTCLTDRLLEGNNVNNETIHCSEIKLYLDMTNQQVAYTIYFAIMKSFHDFAVDQLTKMWQNPRLAEWPVVLEEPVYGEREPNFVEFVAPGLILAIVHFMAQALTTLSVIAEKKEGLLDRSLVAGVSHWEVLLSIMTTQFFIMVTQIVFILIMMFVVFNIPIRGSVFWVIFCLFISGLSGMSFGLLVSSLFTDEPIAMMTVLGTFAPTLILCGMFWPLEAVPRFLQLPSYGLPLTLLLNTMRSIMSRGWSVADNHIWDGILVNLAWCFGLAILAGIIFKYKK